MVTPVDIGALTLGVGAVAFVAYRVGYRRGALASAMPAIPELSWPNEALSLSVGIDLLGDPALLVDASLRIIAANAGATALHGNLVPGADLRLALRNPVIFDLAAEAAASPDAVTSEVNVFGAGEAAYRVRAVNVGNSRVLLGFVDITQARLTERMRVDFVANASHELRTPLATLVGFIETLQGPAAEDSAARHRFLDIMASEAARMSRLIDDLLSLSRIELDKYIRPQTKIALAPLFADVARTLAMRLEADERILLIDLPPGLPDVIADRDQILQVLHNLISNALKYGRNGTPISIVASRISGKTSGVRMSVIDRGEGIAPEHLPRLTERFYRIDTSRSRSLGGTGLGLSIAKHIVERHGGTLKVVSEVGEGTCVSFTLPAAQ